MAEIADVCVVGAGPGGATAAAYLARAGLRVILVDKAPLGRDKCCGDGLTAKALGELEALGIEPSDIASWQWIGGVSLRSPSGTEREFQFPRNGSHYAAVARRRELDAELVQRAAQAGATVLSESAVAAVAESDDHVEVTVRGLGTLTCRYLVAADGAWSKIRALILPMETERTVIWQAFRAYLKAEETFPPVCRVSFDEDLLPGYVWSFPLADGTVNFGFGVAQPWARAGRAKPRRLWAELFDRPHLRYGLVGGDEELTPQGWVIPSRLPDQTLATRRVLFVGDAAGLADPMTGEGIGQAMASGRFAAEAIVASRDREAARAYVDRVRSAFEKEFKLSLLLHQFLRHRKGVRIPVWTFGLTPASRAIFALWLFEAGPRLGLGNLGWIWGRYPEGAYAERRSDTPVGL